MTEPKTSGDEPRESLAALLKQAVDVLATELDALRRMREQYSDTNQLVIMAKTSMQDAKYWVAGRPFKVSDR